MLNLQVSNAQEELLQWYAETAKGNCQIIHATERCAAGIIQAIGNFSVGPNVSPRDIMEFEKLDGKVLNPGHEIVKFYIFYERWLNGEIETSEQYMQTLNSTFVSYFFRT